MKSITSTIDGSKNWIIPFKKSFVEARYVRRAPHYISAYLSSHNGCKMQCKFCWLTATDQKEFNHVELDLYKNQLHYILKHSKDIDKDKSKDIRVNINMMARGEALANKIIINHYPDFYNSMNNMIQKEYGYKETKINLSTIMPNVIINRNLIDIFKDEPVNLYYSLYSINDQFRKKWLPNAIPWNIALNKLKDYQIITSNPIAFHFALIENENDNLEDVKKMTDEIIKMKFDKTKFNIVRFNPHSSMNEYKETNEYKMDKIYKILQSVANDEDIKTNKSRIVLRSDTKTRSSCGLFVTNDEYDNI